MIHYETKSWAKVLLRVRGSVLPRIAGRMLFVVALALAAAYLQLSLGWDIPQSGTLHAIVGAALGLLLVFRTNASYDRYWEGRKLIGGMVNNCRDLARQSAAHLGHAEPAVRQRIGRLTIAMFVSIRRALRGTGDEAKLAELLSEAERAKLATVSAPPLWVARWLTDLLVREAEQGRLSQHQLQLMDGTLADLIDLWGGAERIVKTPVPFAYAQHIKGFLTIFCTTVPLALLGPMGWYAPLGAAVVAYGLYGIDEIGVEIEDPFGFDDNDLDLDGIGDTIERNVRDLLLEESRSCCSAPSATASSTPT